MAEGMSVWIMIHRCKGDLSTILNSDMLYKLQYKVTIFIHVVYDVYVFSMRARMCVCVCVYVNRCACVCMVCCAPVHVCMLCMRV